MQNISSSYLCADPKAKVPVDDLGYRDTLGKLVRLDGYSEANVIAALTWTLSADDEQAEFWRKQVCSFGNLRATRNGMSKFGRIHERWTEATRASGNGHSPPQPADALNEKPIATNEMKAVVDELLDGGDNG